MRRYNPKMKARARTFRANMTDAERLLWSRLRGKQLLGVQFYRQKPLGNYIVDFYAPRVNLVVEVDGSQHYEPDGVEYDRARGEYLAGQGLMVLRFDNVQALREVDGVIESVFREMSARLKWDEPKSP